MRYLLVLVAALALIGSFGPLRLPTFYEGVHPPTMGTTLGVAFTVAASILALSAIESRLTSAATGDFHRRWSQS
jgi:multicomponent K+:H+ antiporter subunit G